MGDRYTKAHLNSQETSLGGVRRTLITLPPEIRTMILRHVLGDRTVHVYYKLELHYEKGEIRAKVSYPSRPGLNNT